MPFSRQILSSIHTRVQKSSLEKHSFLFRGKPHLLCIPSSVPKGTVPFPALDSISNLNTCFNKDNFLFSIAPEDGNSNF